MRVAGLSGVRVHPAPFYEAVLDLAIFGVVNAVALFGAPIGVPAALTALFYALGRFAVEFSRNNQGRMIVGPFSLNHAICLVMALAGAVTLHYAMQAAVVPPALSWSAAVAAAPALLPVFVVGALLVFLGFSTHRGRVGGSRRWLVSLWALTLVWAWAGSVGGSTDARRDGAQVDSPLLLARQEYNQTAAAIDTIVRIFGRQQLERLADADRTSVELPEGIKPVLLFWADDEAELFLNGNPISRARLTPTRVEIPAFHLEAENELLAHVWDTDRVESGFMCGLYLEDELGLLTPILTSGEGEWETQQGTGAEEIFYAHPQPDIPEARVIWGDRLFGEVWLRARFSGESVRRALSRSPLPPSVQPDQKWQRESMEFDTALSRLVLLQEKRAELGRILKEKSGPRELFVRFSPPPASVRPPVSPAVMSLAFTLGRAGPLSYEAEVRTSPQLQHWARALPPRARELIFREARELKGWSAATDAVEFGGASQGEENRRTDYQPPPERGPAPVGWRAGGREGGGEAADRSARRGPVTPWLLLSVLCLYVGGVCGQWWRIFHRPGWLR